MIWLPLCAAFALVGAGGASTTKGFKEEWERWMNKSHPTLQRDSAAGAPDTPTGPLRVAKAGGKPLWMEEADELDPRLTEITSVVESTERKSTHWTLRGDAVDNPSVGDGGA